MQAIQSVVPAATSFPGASCALENEINNPLRRIAFRIALVLIFLRFGMFHFLLLEVMHINLYLMYVFGVPALIGLAASGGVQRTFRGRTALYWIGYAAWIVLAIPFSTWRGGSFQVAALFLRAEMPMMFLMAGFALNWRECRALLAAVAWGAAASVAAVEVLQRSVGTRVGLDAGAVGNPNDYAAHLLLVLPFLLWSGFHAKWRVTRPAALACVPAGLYVILATGSRGAVVALCAAGIFFLARAPMRRRLIFLALMPAVAAGLVAVVPQDIWDRLRSFSKADPQAVAEAVASQETRLRVFRRSLMDTLTHPIFGVGPMQFMSYEGSKQPEGRWLEPHNTFTQVSSECGIPALIFFVGAIAATFRIFNSIYKQARERPDCEDIRDAAFCLLLALTGFCVAIMFLNFAYFFYLPAMSGLAIALSGAAGREMDERMSRAPLPAPLWAGAPVPARREARSEALAAGPAVTPRQKF